MYFRLNKTKQFKYYLVKSECNFVNFTNILFPKFLTVRDYFVLRCYKQAMIVISVLDVHKGKNFVLKMFHQLKCEMFNTQSNNLKPQQSISWILIVT